MLEIGNWMAGGALFGIATAIFAAMLDFAMDYGHLLGNIRYNKARRICHEIKAPQLFDQFEKQLEKIIDFGERMEYADNFYWQLAALRNSFTAWICKICFGARINFALALALVLSGSYIGEDLLALANAFIVSILVNFFMLKKVI